MPLFCKKSNFCQNYTIYYGRKKSIAWPFFRFSQKKYCPNSHVVSKRRPFSKKHIALISCPYFVKKRPFAQKHCTLMSRFFNFYMKNPMLSCPYLIKNPSILSKLNCIMDQKSQQDALFFRIFHGKITSLMPIFCQEDVHSRKNTLLSSPYFIKKRPVSQKHGALMSVFQFFYEKFPAVKPIFGKKTSILFKLHYIMGPTTQKDVLFFRFFTKIIARLSNNVHSLKNTLFSCPFLSKNPIL